MDNTASTFYHFIQQFKPALSGQRLGIAVSGGVDSIVLLHLANRFKELFHYQLQCIHFHHGLREHSSQEEQSVLSFCDSLQVPCLVKRFLPEDWKKAPGTGIEEKARELRNQYYAELLDQHLVDWILLGHSRDDWEETVMFHFIRGCSPSHLSDALKHTDPARKIIRPLLQLPKSKLIEYANHFHLPTHDDETNTNTDYSRNKIRHALLPLIREMNPNFGQALQHFTSLLRIEEEAVQKMTDETFHRIVTFTESDSCCVDKAAWLKLDEAFQLRILKKIRENLIGNQRDFYYSQLISIQMGIITNRYFHYEDKKLCIDCTDEYINVRKQAMKNE